MKKGKKEENIGQYIVVLYQCDLFNEFGLGQQTEALDTYFIY